jgi:diguanylate cyclase (GGDEF)-like protein
MSALSARFWAAGEIDPRERGLAGRASGVLYSLGAVTLASLAVLPGIDHSHRTWVLSIAGGALVWGLISALAIDWDRAPRWLIHISNTVAFPVIGGAVAASGGAASPAWIYLFFIAIFSSYFYRPVVAAGYLLGCVVTHAMPLLYDSGALHGRYPSELVLGPPTYIVFGTTLMLGKNLMRQLAARSELLAAEQGALVRIATAVIEGEEPESIYTMVSREAAGLVRAGAAGILRFEGASIATVVGAWADREGGSYPPGMVVEVKPGSDLDQARERRKAIGIQGHAPDSPVGRLGHTTSIVSPVIVGQRCWGALAVASRSRITERDERKLMGFCDLLARAIASIDERATLAAQAATDPLTGLCNRRALHERLAAETARVHRHDGTLSVALIDVDHFKRVNDRGGHEAGDETLVDVARCLTEHARTEDTLGRIGGDEFAWIMPETTAGEALVAVERVRRLIALTSANQPITVSAGICDTDATAHPAQLVNYADNALYWSKAHGRNRAWIYSGHTHERPDGHVGEVPLT